MVELSGEGARLKLVEHELRNELEELRNKPRGNGHVGGQVADDVTEIEVGYIAWAHLSGQLFVAVSEECSV